MTKSLFLFRKVVILIILGVELLLPLYDVALVDVVPQLWFLAIPIPFFDADFGRVLGVVFLAMEATMSLIKGGIGLFKGSEV